MTESDDSEVKPEIKAEIKTETGQHHHVKLKPGQKHHTPSPGVAERIFYETLYHQNPDSPMAQEWCVLYGVLPAEEAAKIHKIVQRRKVEGKNGTPSKSSAKPAPKPPKANGSKSRKRAKLDDDADVDTGLREGVYEGVGSVEI